MRLTIEEEGIIYDALKLWREKYTKDKYPPKLRKMDIGKYQDWYMKELRNKDTDLYWYGNIVENINKLCYEKNKKKT